MADGVLIDGKGRRHAGIQQKWSVSTADDVNLCHGAEVCIFWVIFVVPPDGVGFSGTVKRERNERTDDLV